MAVTINLCLLGTAIITMLFHKDVNKLLLTDNFRFTFRYETTVSVSSNNKAVGWITEEITVSKLIQL
jgi:hypothetical protein